MTVRIVQLLCPSRHCIIAAVYESEDGAEKPGVAAEFPQRLEAAGLNASCGLCGSRELHTEDNRTEYSSVDEAMPVLQDEKARQRLVLSMLRNLRRILGARLN